MYVNISLFFLSKSNGNKKIQSPIAARENLEKILSKRNSALDPEVEGSDFRKNAPQFVMASRKSRRSHVSALHCAYEAAEVAHSY